MREGEGGGKEGKSPSSLSLCPGRDSHAIRLINEIIDHLMGLIINTVLARALAPPLSSSFLPQV